MHMTRTKRPWQRGSVGDVTAAAQDSTGFGFEVPRTRQAGWLVSDVVSLAPCWRTQREAEEGGLALDLCGERTGVARRSILGCAAPTCLLAIPWHSGVAFGSLL